MIADDSNFRSRKKIVIDALTRRRARCNLRASDFFFVRSDILGEGLLHKDIHSRALKQAAKVLGGDDALRQHLGASEGDFSAWSGKTDELPRNIFLRLVDIITREEPKKRR
jgi:hypothetical protein